MGQIDFFLRPATPNDLSAVDALLQRSYPRLLAADYPPSIMVTAVPMIARARPELLASGRYLLAIQQDRVVGAGGYSLAAPVSRGAADGPHTPGIAHIRHVATDPDFTRLGIASALMQAIFRAATAEGAVAFDCLSTRTAEAFYAAQGFVRQGLADIVLSPGILFPAIRMRRTQ